jgi:tetratricopeptide (TPR) repeat protein
MNISSNKANLLIDLAKIYLELGQKAKALDTLSKALEAADVNDVQKESDSPLKVRRDHFVPTIAMVYAKAGLLDPALELVNSITEPSKRATALSRVASELIESGQTAKTSELLSQALKLLNPADDERATLSHIAATYAKIGECDQALYAIERIPAEWEYSKSHALAAIAAKCAKAGRNDKAAEIISRALKSVNSMKGTSRFKDVDLNFKAEALAEVATAYIDLGEADKAASLLPRAVQTVAGLQANSVALEKVAVAYAKASRYTQAIDTAKSISYKPVRAETVVKIAREHINAGKMQAGTELLSQAFELTGSIAPANDPFRIKRLSEIASEFARAGEHQKASETFLYALKEAWAASKYAQPEMIVEIARSYARAKMDPDAEAKEVLKKICSGEPIPPTPDELAKQRRAGEVAARFTERWHETLDLNVLFNEMYVTNAEQGRQNAYLFYGVYQFLTGAGEGPAVAKDVDEKLMLEGFMTFWNLYYLLHEYDLAFSKSSDSDVTLPPEYSAAYEESLKNLSLNEKKMSAAPIRQYIAKANFMSSLLRKYLKPEVFETDLYKQNLKIYLEGEGDDTNSFHLDHRFSEFGVRENVEVYRLKRGLFEFYLIEEKGELRVLTLGFEL